MADAQLSYVGTDAGVEVQANDSNNQISAAGGNDTIVALGGTDFVAGNDGDDILYVNDGEDPSLVALVLIQVFLGAVNDISGVSPSDGPSEILAMIRSMVVLVVM